MQGIDRYRTLARLQAAELDSLYEKGNIFANKYSMAIQKAASAALRHGMKIGEINLDSAENEMVGFAAYCYLRGLAAYERARNPAGASLSLSSSFDRQLKRISESFELNLGDLNKQVRSLVGGKTRESLSYVRDRINETLTDISARKISYGNGNKLLQSELRRMGLTTDNPSYIQTLVRTHSQLTYNAAQWVELATDENVWGFVYITMRDDRVRETHQELDGITRRRFDPVWNVIWPPNGWNCRCQCVALYEPEEITRLPRDIVDLVDPEFQFNPGIEFGEFKPISKQRARARWRV